MKHLIFLISLTLCVWNQAAGQLFRANVSEITFNETDELGLDSASITINNFTINPYTIKKSSVHFLNTYSAPAFFIKSDSLILPSQGSGVLKVYFKPRHNILHQSCMVIYINNNDIQDHFGSIAIQLTGQGKYSKTYYNSTQNLKEQALRDALKTRISTGYTSLGYNIARNRMFEEIDNKRLNGQGATVNTLECIYTTTLCTGYTNRSNAQSMCSFDTEHTFPQGFFNSADPMQSDLYHLFPTRSNANNSRGNLAFGVATQPYQQEATNAPSKRGANNLYEPHDGQKGPTARGMMYFVVRYQDYNNFFAPQENILRQWHNTYMPTSIEQRRNDDISTLQNNRNPFIDYPQFAERITKLVGPTAELPLFELKQYDTAINYVTAGLTPGLPNDSTSELHYIVVNKGNQNINLSQITPNNTQIRIINSGNAILAPGRAYIIKLKIKNEEGVQIQNYSFTYSTNIPGQPSITVPINITNLVVGNNDKFQKPAVEVFPNPASDWFVVKFKPSPVTTMPRFELIDMIGKNTRLDIERQSDTEYRISTSAAFAGVYHLKVLLPGEAPLLKKVVVSR